jgi:Flp pilus assembly pilin Flp
MGEAPCSFALCSCVHGTHNLRWKGHGKRYCAAYRLLRREMGAEMIFDLHGLHAKLSFLLTSKAAKDLTEYTLVLTLITFGAVTSMNSLSGVLTEAFLGFSTSLGRYIS